MGFTEFLYETHPGSILLRLLISRPFSRVSGRLLDTGLSKLLIKPFISHTGIDPNDYILDDIGSFNEFFSRRIRMGLRPIDMKEDSLIAPCDGLLKVISISEGTIIPAKQSSFTVKDLLRDRELARNYDGGLCLVYRLCVNHYHRYIYFDSGRKYKNRRIDGFYHTVRPVALKGNRVFCENTREYSVIDTDNFGRCVQMEVGAMLVGRIVNITKEKSLVRRGDEKGYFEYGASTVIVLLPGDTAVLCDRFKEAVDKDMEIPVSMGQMIGRSIVGPHISSER